MHSTKVPLWRIVLHMLGLHWWSDLQYWEIDDPTADTGIYQVCEICAKEKVLHTPY